MRLFKKADAGSTKHAADFKPPWKYKNGVASIDLGCGLTLFAGMKDQDTDAERWKAEIVDMFAVRLEYKFHTRIASCENASAVILAQANHLMAAEASRYGQILKCVQNCIASVSETETQDMQPEK